jgi:hypothetical protein
MVLIALPWFASELVAALIAAIAVLLMVRTRRVVHAQPFDHTEQAIADLTLKVRRPWTYRAKIVGRWFDGER